MIKKIGITTFISNFIHPIFFIFTFYRFLFYNKERMQFANWELQLARLVENEEIARVSSL